MRLFLILALLPLATHARPGCFDNWFCFTLTPTEGQYDVVLTRKQPYPVVVTLKPGSIGSTAIVQALGNNTPHTLGQVNKPSAFWHNMRISWNAGTAEATHNDTVRYDYPIKNRKISIVQGFNGAFSHTGRSRYAVDFDVPVGTPVFAARRGQVIDTEASHNRGGPTENYAPYANYVVVLHDDGTTGEYYHLKQGGIAVKRGEHVARGDLLGYSGETGFASLPHLHFGVYRINSQGQFETVMFRFADTN